MSRRYAVSISDGAEPLIEKDFRTRTEAAQFIASITATSRIKYMRIEIGVIR